MKVDVLISHIVFLALVVWREARGESILGQTAVAHSVLNRVHKPGWWGTDIMSVVFKKWQYSSMTDPHDPQLTAWPKNDAVWQQCLQVAWDVVYGMSENPAPTADSYFDDSISPPKWATLDTFVRKIGRLSFYNVDRDIEVIPGVMK